MAFSPLFISAGILFNIRQYFHFQFRDVWKYTPKHLSWRGVRRDALELVEIK
jgi:hypothetical protein